MHKDAPQSRPATKSSRPTLIDLVEEMSAYECFAGDGPCPTRYEAGTRPILIVSGSNAGGKSLYLRALSAQLQAGAKPAPEVMLISMNLRIQPDIRRAFIFGEDKCGFSVKAVTAPPSISRPPNLAGGRTAVIVALRFSRM